MAKKNFTITLDSKDLDQQLKTAIRRAPEKTARAVYGILLDLAGKSARRAPIESGDLRNDCTAELNKRVVYQDQGIKSLSSATLRAYGTVGYSLPYALRQHEDLTLRHDRTDGYRRADGSTVNMVAGGEAKYLERPWNENVARYEKKIALIVDEVTK